MIGCLFSLDLLDSFSFVMLLIVCGTWIYIFLDEMEFAGDWTFCIMQNKRTLVELNTFNNVIQMCIRYDLLLFY